MDGNENNMFQNLANLEDPIMDPNFEPDFSPREACIDDNKIANTSFEGFGDEEMDPELKKVLELSKKEQWENYLN